jgi:hypothetical protein
MKADILGSDIISHNMSGPDGYKFCHYMLIPTCELSNIEPGI